MDLIFNHLLKNVDVKDGNDADLTQEPETIKAFRDTWELGIHSPIYDIFRDHDYF